jgi:hypothetical protein
MVSRHHLLATVGIVRRPDHLALAEGPDRRPDYQVESQRVVD